MSEPYIRLWLQTSDFLYSLFVTCTEGGEIWKASTKSITILVIFHIKYSLPTLGNAPFTSFPIRALTLFRMFALACLSDIFSQTDNCQLTVYFYHVTYACRVTLYSTTEAVLPAPKKAELLNFKRLQRDLNPQPLSL